MYTSRSDYHGGYEAAKARQEELRAERAQDRLAAQARGGQGLAPLVATAVTRIIQSGLRALRPGRPWRVRQAGRGVGVAVGAAARHGSADTP